MKQQQTIHPGLRIPYWLKNAFKYIIRSGLEIEGLFRIAGQKTVVKELRDALDAGVEINFQEKKTEITALADLMKIFFRELPECLLMFENYTAFLDVLQIPERADQVKQIRSLIGQLPPVNQELLYELLNFLRFLAVNNGVNKMNADNIGLVWGPNLLWNNPSGSASNMLDILAGAGKIRFLVTIMLEDFDTIFEARRQLDTGHNIAGYSIGLANKLIGHTKSVQALITVDNHIWSASSSGVIRVYDTSNYNCVTEIDTKETRPYCLGLIHDKIFVGFANVIKVYSKTFELIKELKEFAVCFLEVDGRMWVGSEERIKVINPDTFKVEQDIPLPKGHFALSMSFVPAFSNVWVGCTYGNIIIINTKEYEIVRQCNTSKKNIDALCAYNGTRDMVFMWAGTGDGAIYIFNCKNYEAVVQLRDQNMMSVYHIASFGRTIWTCSRDARIRLWDPEKLQRLALLDDCHSDAVSRVAFHQSADERWHAWTSSFDKSICVWRIDVPKK